MPQVNEFIVHQYLHGKTLLALEASHKLLKMAGVGVKHMDRKDGKADEGVILADGKDKRSGADRFIAAVEMHRHHGR